MTKKLSLFFSILFLISCGSGDDDTVEQPQPTPSNFVITSINDDVGGVINSGSVILVDGATGVQIGSTISGDDSNDTLGDSSVTSLNNGNFVIASGNDDVGGVTDAGSVMLIDGSTGTQIGSTISGDDANDRLGSSGILALSNGNFVIISNDDDVSGLADAGSVILVDGATGVQIGSTITGDDANDFFGGFSSKALNNGNFVIASSNDNVGGLSNAGSVMLIDGSTGVQIGSTISGDDSNDSFGSSVAALTNGNFAVASNRDDEGGLTDVGSVMLFDGTTGVQIGSTFFGDNANDQIGAIGVVALSNGNYVVSSNFDDVGGITNSGSVILFDGTTGVQIGSTIAGDDAEDRLGRSSITDLGNGNFVIASANDDVNGLTNCGSIMLVDGATGVQIGSTIAGDNENDRLGEPFILALNNNNYVVVSDRDDVGGITDAGSVSLFDGSTGVQIGSTISGDEANDRLGRSGAVGLFNSNYIIASQNDNIVGVNNVGSVMLFDGSNAEQIGSTINGDDENDNLGISGVFSLSNGNFVIASSFDDVGGISNSGSVMLIDGTTGVQIGNTLSGDNTSDWLGQNGITNIEIPE